jgi:hypothetical protein
MTANKRSNATALDDCGVRIKNGLSKPGKYGIKQAAVRFYNNAILLVPPFRKLSSL